MRTIFLNKTSLFFGLLFGAVFGLSFPALGLAATLNLSPSSGSYDLGQTFSVDVLLDTTGANIDGVDIKYLRYDRSRLELLDGDSSTSGVQIQKGSLMPGTLTNSADTNSGTVMFSQIVNTGSSYTGSGILATLNFKVIAGGTARISIDYTSGKTTDSNVASVGQDVLNSVTSAQFTLSGPPPANTGGPGASVLLRLVNLNGTYYVVKEGQRLGVTNPGMLFSYGLEFKDAKSATAQDQTLPEGPILSPGDGALVKSPTNPTVYLISLGQKHGFASEAVFKGLGFKFNKVLTVTAPELDKMPLGEILGDSNLPHKPGTDINYNGTIYYIGSDNRRYGYPSQEVWNSWHFDNDFSNVVPANNADISLGVGDVVSLRKIE